MKRLIFVVALLALSLPAMADYEFGKVATVLSDFDRDLIVDVGVTPIGRIDFSMRWYVQYTTSSDTDSDFKVEDSFVGPSVRIPLCEPLDALGTAIEPYVGASALWHVESKDDVYTPLSAGLDIDIAPQVNAIVELQYSQNEGLFRDEEWKVFAGVKLEW